MSEEVIKTIETVAATMRNMTEQGRREYAAHLEGISQGVEIARRETPAKEDN